MAARFAVGVLMRAPIEEIDIVIAWLIELEMHVRQVLPFFDGGDTGKVCRETVLNLEILKAAGWTQEGPGVGEE
jgi:hypothetical protein